MTDLPRGTVTFLMTDVEGSTDLWQRYGAAMDRALIRLDADIHRVVRRHDGAVIKSRGEGDSHFAVFDRASSAICAAV
jgi:class 3 adenylate cyclase